MEEENFKNRTTISCSTKNKSENGDDNEDVLLPGFRFHPTDEELVGFYLRRKVENRVLHFELIKEVDIYKYNPWDLPKASNVGEKEWYFFCKRGRKYRNSIRPNRVTDSGFWKATGIDKPIYSSERIAIGLKKSLVFYRGSAGKGTKTDWMMHEFRIPNSCFHSERTTQVSQEEAEVWTLCRILNRGKQHKRCIPDWREISLDKSIPANTSSKTWSPDTNQNHELGFISFQVPRNDNKQLFNHCVNNSSEMLVGEFRSINQASNIAPSMKDCSNYVEWDELGSLLNFAAEPFYSFGM